MADSDIVDVVIFNVSTRAVHSVVGVRLPRLSKTSRFDATRRLESASRDAPEGHAAMVVPTGKYKAGDTLE